jgi:hypothetical protein
MPFPAAFFVKVTFPVEEFPPTTVAGVMATDEIVWAHAVRVKTPNESRTIQIVRDATSFSLFKPFTYISN